MVTFQISINGKPYCESEDITVLTMVVEELRSKMEPRVVLHAGSTDEGSLQWLKPNLKIGDEIVVRVVETAEQEDLEPPRCSFCGRESHEVSSLIAGQSAYICDGCINSFTSTLKGGTELPLGASIRDEHEWICGLCGKQPGTIPGVIVRNGAAVCPECLHACSDLLSDDFGNNSSGGK